MNTYGNALIYNGMHRVTKSDVEFYDVEISDEDKQRLINAKILEMTKVGKGYFGFFESEYFARNFNLEAVTPHGVDYTGAMYFGEPGIPFTNYLAGKKGPAILLKNGVIVNPISFSSKANPAKGISTWELKDATHAVAKDYDTGNIIEIPRFFGRVHLPGGGIEVDATPEKDNITTTLEYQNSPPLVTDDNRHPLQKLADEATETATGIQTELDLLNDKFIALNDQFTQLKANKTAGNQVFLDKIKNLDNTISSLQENSNLQTAASANANAISNSKIQELSTQLIAKQNLLAKCESRAIGLASEATALLQAGNACDEDVERLQQEKARLDADLILAREEGTKSITVVLVGAVAAVLFVIAGAAIALKYKKNPFRVKM